MDHEVRFPFFLNFIIWGWTTLKSGYCIFKPPLRSAYPDQWDKEENHQRKKSLDEMDHNQLLIRVGWPNLQS